MTVLAPAPSPLETRRARPVAGVQRRVFHLLAGSVFPVALLFSPRWPVLGAVVFLAGGSILIEIVRRRWEPLDRFVVNLLRPLLKEHEADSVIASTWMLAAMAVVIGTMPKPVAILALFCLSVGDPFAALIGQRWGSIRIAAGKTLEGAGGFLAGSLAVGALLVATKVDTTYGVMALGAAVATLAELWPPRIEDNVKIPIAAGVAMTVARHFWA
ncbi:MAG: hypothetical protein HY261_10810 [Chloroflexi bacterium]|nr:hypothetical protein [Chloroflexota bacterium]